MQVCTKQKILQKIKVFFFATLQEQLNYVRFPLGNYKKSEIRNLAKKYELDVSDKPDSQDICFVTSDSYRNLINNLNPETYKKEISWI